MTMTMADAAVDDGSMGPRAERPKRRVFTAEYKAAIVAEYDQASEPGAKGAILRREGLYSSHVIDWRRARDAAGVAGLGRPPRDRRAEQVAGQIAALQARAEEAEAELAKTQAALEIVGKLHALLEDVSKSAEPATSLTPRPRKRSTR